MSIFEGGEVIVIHRSSSESVDAYGNPEPGEATLISVSNVLVSFETTSEGVEVARDPQDAKLTLYMPTGTVIEESDLFEVRGSMWLKDGIAKNWLASGFDAGVVVHVRQRLG